LGPLALRTVDLREADAGPQLDAALRADGFVQLVGHDIDWSLVEELRAGMDEFFALPPATKTQFEIADPLVNRGYRAPGSESLSYALGVAGLPDLFESFNVGHPDRHAPPLISPTPWPVDARFTDAALRYLREMAALANRIDVMIDELVGIGNLAERSRSGPDTMACIRYMRATAAGGFSPDHNRMGAHSDYTTFSILTPEPVVGLEILTSNGWQAVIPDPDVPLLNVGDLLAIWTNDEWPSTVHRVPIRGDGTDPGVRRTIAYFHYPDLEVEVGPLPGFGPSRYQPTTVADHLAGMLAGPKTGTLSTGTSTIGRRTL
jgi:isopenicillin N synthase-like dioxygenase